jgi:hydrogenase maturation protease
MKTLVLGLGNPILSDDGVGIRVAHEVASQVNNPQITVTETSGAGLSLLDSITGYDGVIIIDSIQTREGNAGQIYRLGLEDFSFTKYFSSPHQVNLATALELGRMLGLAMPQRVIIFAVEAKDVTTFGEKCTPEVEQVIPEVVKMVQEELNERHNP